VIGKYSGIEGYYEEVGGRLAATGHEVTVYCRTFFTPLQRDHNGMRLVRLPTVRSKHLETALHTALSTLHVLFRPCDIVHYHTLGPALFSLVPRLVGKRTAVTVQGLDWKRKKWGRAASAVLRLGERAAVWCPDTTMVVSRTLRSYFQEQYRAETRYIANGALLRERRPANKILEWGLRPAGYVLFLGRFSPEKNCHLLINAYAGIETEVQLVLAGGGSRRDAYYHEILGHASNRVRLLEYVSGDAFDELLTNAMLFVLPSDLEGLSLALLEAMGAGLCVLASDIPENRELVEGAGFLFRPGDQADLQRMLRVLMANQDLREKAGKAARQRIQEQYLWPKIAQEIEQTYLEMMGWPGAAPVFSAIPDGAQVRALQEGRPAGAIVIPMPPDGTSRVA
jgi:glycosyltransferase involved in cell wall biosynthesis